MLNMGKKKALYLFFSAQSRKNPQPGAVRMRSGGVCLNRSVVPAVLPDKSGIQYRN
jgi:hypothetical protein